MSNPDWVMIRVPRKLKEALEAYGCTIQNHEPKRQGNHEDNQAIGPPLWRTIERLLQLESDHKKRSRKNSVGGAKKRTGKEEKATAGQQKGPAAKSQGSVYTGRVEPIATDLPGQGHLFPVQEVGDGKLPE